MNLIEAKSWAEELDVQVTVCDLNGIIVYMNQASKLGFIKYGGADLIGKSLLDCHNSKSQEKIKEMLDYPHVNSYIIKKDNEKRMIHQLPWTEFGENKGLVELSFLLPSTFEEKNQC